MLSADQRLHPCCRLCSPCSQPDNSDVNSTQGCSAGSCKQLPRDGTRNMASHFSKGVTGGRLRSPSSQDMNIGAERGPKCRGCLGRSPSWETVGPFRSISSSNDGTQFIISAYHTEAEANQLGRLKLRRFSGPQTNLRDGGLYPPYPASHAHQRRGEQ